MKVQPKSNIDWFGLIEDRSATKKIQSKFFQRSDLLFVLYPFIIESNRTFSYGPAKLPEQGQQIMFSFDYNADVTFIYSGNIITLLKLLQLIMIEEVYPLVIRKKKNFMNIIVWHE